MSPGPRPNSLDHQEGVIIGKQVMVPNRDTNNTNLVVLV